MPSPVHVLKYAVCQADCKIEIKCWGRALSDKEGSLIEVRRMSHKSCIYSADPECGV